MKTKSVYLIVVLLLTGGYGATIQAQQTLAALIKKYETMENVQVNLVERKDRATKKMERRIVTITIPENESIRKEIESAFSKDRADAYSAIENRNHGKIDNYFYKFDVNGADVSYSYALNNGPITLTVIERYD